jgi:hypothetical protein
LHLTAKKIWIMSWSECVTEAPSGKYIAGNDSTHLFFSFLPKSTIQTFIISFYKRISLFYVRITSEKWRALHSRLYYS